MERHRNKPVDENYGGAQRADLFELDPDAALRPASPEHANFSSMRSRCFSVPCPLPLYFTSWSILGSCIKPLWKPPRA